jgi:hypothetical protein
MYLGTLAANTTSGWDRATAIGTIAAATVAAAGLIVSLVIAGSDRRAADKRAVDDRRSADDRAVKDRQAADDRAASDRLAIREQYERQHLVSLLLRMGEEYGRYVAYGGMPQASEAVQNMQLLAAALPGGSYAALLRTAFSLPGYDRKSTMDKLIQLRGRFPELPQQAPPTVQDIHPLAYVELASDITRVMDSE